MLVSTACCRKSSKHAPQIICPTVEVADCIQSIHFEGQYKATQKFHDPKSFLYIPDLKYNNAGENEILNLNIFFKGAENFAVILSSEANVNGIAFETGAFFQ